jgi:cytochrome P450
MSSAIVAGRKKAPGVSQVVPIPGFGPLARSRRDPLGFLLEGRARYGDVFRYQLGPLVFHLVAHPEYVKHVLVDHARNYPRSWYYSRTKVVVGEGLVTTEGAAWRRLRRLSQPAFHHQRVGALAGLMTDCAEAMLGGWRELARSREPLDLAAEFVALTLRIVGRALLSIDLAGEADRVGRAVTTALEYLERRLSGLLVVPPFVPTSGNLRARRALRILDNLVFDIIAARRREPDRVAHDLLAMLLAVRDEDTGESFNDAELRDQVLTFIGAGHETTAVALAWTVYLLARHPEAESRLRAEVAATLGDRTPIAEDLPRLPFTRRVIEESLRLYPPVYAVVRDAVDEDEIGGYGIPPRSMIILSPYVTHRHPEVWPDPGVFDPNRFTPERASGRSRFAWFPFLAGPHPCIGQEFAMMEMTLVIAMVIQAFRFRIAPGARVEPRPMLSLRPRDGLPMLLEPVR